MIEGTPGIILAAALVPVLAWAVVVGLVLRRPSLGNRLVAFAWGAAVAAPVSWHLATRWHLDPVVGGPLVEEVLKAAPVLLLALGRERVLDAIGGAAFAGLGFAATENVYYMTMAALQGGPAGLVRGVWVRGILQGLNHAVFTGATGAGLGLAWHARAGTWRVLAPLLGLALAVGEHALWNGLASGAVTDVLCNPTAAGGVCRDADAVDLFVATPLIVALVVGPGALVLCAILRRTDGRIRPGPSLG